VLVTNCSGRKSVVGSTGLAAADLPRAAQPEIGKEWTERVRHAPQAAQAQMLYSGRAVKRMRRLAEDLAVPLYIASAGLGLVKGDEPIPSYDLSISPHNAAAVQKRVSGAFSAEAWWASVQRSPYARPVSDLLTGAATDLVLIAVSNAYVPLLAGDLSRLPDPQRGRLRLFAPAEARYPESLRPYLMPYDARVDQLVPGSRVDFAQRACEHFILGARTERRFPGSLEQQRAWVTASLTPLAPRVRAKREAVDDGRIRMLARSLAAQGLTYTSALNALRKKHGIACEQGRFRRLFLEASR
jgi:hypothetical protein